MPPSVPRPKLVPGPELMEGPHGPDDVAFWNSSPFEWLPGQAPFPLDSGA